MKISVEFISIKKISDNNQNKLILLIILAKINILLFLKNIQNFIALYFFI